ncbi:helix-turn-helix domain-containing protein [Candidatus Bathyarchaeota archaeon]|nr:helix-turn-helix domain-containing protein [Candidatus Bathyarchaeota archaeon]
MVKMRSSLLKALSSPTRVNILSMIRREQMHISALAKRLRVSVPVAAKHVRILENAGLIERREYGRSHILTAKTSRMESMLDELASVSTIELPRGSSVLDALRKTCLVDTKRVDGNEYIVSIDGREGFYLYEVNNRLADVSMNKYRLKGDVEIALKRMIPVTERRIMVKVR